jgi:Glycoside hydrolase family 44/Bacterial Ig-like domain (group 3)
MRISALPTLLVRCVLLWLALGVALATAQTVTVPALTVDPTLSRAPISAQIYGIASYGLDASFAQEIQVPNVRWGGDGTTRYNWMVDSSNSGFDWYFIGGNGQTTPVPGASVDLMVKTYAPANALITIPIIPWVNKSAAWSCSFPVSVYGPQQSIDPYLTINGDSCGNSLTTTGTQLTDSNVPANHIANTSGLQQQWVGHLVSTFGASTKGGVAFYQLDNEPFGWSNTHRDVMPAGATYPTIVQLGQQYAAAVKQSDPGALVLGPSDFTLGGWIGTPSQQGGLYAGQYYLQQMAAYQQQHGQRILDYFDEHYYFNTSTPAAQLASTRTLWDPTYNGGTWVEQYDFNGPMQLIPRFRTWISSYYPGTKLAISEYSIDSGQKSVVDAIAEMDVLGIYGREQLDFANMWSPPAPTDPIAYAFRMFRNYDGNGHQFGDVSISATSTDQGSLSIYGAQRSGDDAITLLVINKTTAAISTSIRFADVYLPMSAKVYTYSAASLAAIVPAADAPFASGSLAYTFPSYSAVLFVVQPVAVSTATSLSTSATQITAGDAVTAYVHVAAQGGSTTPGGTVSLFDGATALGTLALANGGASFPVPGLGMGVHSLAAVYSGVLGFSPSTSTPVSITVSAPGSAPTPDYVLALSASSVSASVTQDASLNVSVVSQNGAFAKLSFACSGVPAGWSCSFSPSSVSGNGTESTTLTVSAAKGAGNGINGAAGTQLAVIWPLPLLLLGLARRGSRQWRLLPALAALVVVAGCGGDSAGSGASATAPSAANSYPITVTASGTNAPTHSAQFTLNVNS